jgi:hypothetical protein
MNVRAHSTRNPSLPFRKPENLYEHQPILIHV